MKYFIIIATILCLGSILSGLLLDVNYNQKLIGFGVVGLFMVVFPVFSYYRWKDKDIKDYMITQENLDKMKNHEKDA